LVFFALAISPPGNVAAAFQSSARRLRAGAFGAWEGLPSAIYLGFYTCAGEPGLESFADEAQRLLDLAPGRIALAEPVSIEGAWFIAEAPRTRDGGERRLEDLVLPARRLAEALGLEPMEDPPFPPGIGFFVGKSVTAGPAGAFSFRHFELRLLEIECSSMGGESLFWRMLARKKRLVGPKPGKPSDGRAHSGKVSIRASVVPVRNRKPIFRNRDSDIVEEG